MVFSFFLSFFKFYYLFILNFLEGQLVPEVLARLRWLLRAYLTNTFSVLECSLLSLGNRKKNYLCLQTINFIVVSMFLFLGFTALWAWSVLFSAIYVSVPFPQR